MAAAASRVAMKLATTAGAPGDAGSVRYPVSTSHGMSRNGPPDLRQHRLREILGWLGRYLKG